MRMLSVDPNTKDTGLVCWHDGQPIKVRSINLPRADRRQMVQRICDAAQEWAAEIVAIEDIYAGDNPHTTIMLAKLVGGIESTIERAGMQIVVISTAEIDKACGIPSGLLRNERKARLKALGSLELGGECIQDVYDAYSVGIAALGRLNVSKWAKEQI